MKGKRLDARPESFSDLWARAKEGSGWKGDPETDAVAIIVSGSKGVSILPQGSLDHIRKIADAFSVMAKIGSPDVKMIELEEVEIFKVSEGRYMIAGGNVSIAVTAKDNERVRRFIEGRITRAGTRPLRLVLSLADFYR